MPSGQIPLRRVAEHTTALDVACNRCPRTTRLVVENLVRQYGTRAGIADILDHQFPDCPFRTGATIYSACSKKAPGLRKWFLPKLTEAAKA